MPYIVLDPTDEPVKTSFTLAPRPEKLQGVTLGVIDNGKKNSDYLLKGFWNDCRPRWDGRPRLCS